MKAIETVMMCYTTLHISKYWALHFVTIVTACGHVGSPTSEVIKCNTCHCFHLKASQVNFNHASRNHKFASEGFPICTADDTHHHTVKARIVSLGDPQLCVKSPALAAAQPSVFNISVLLYRNPVLYLTQCNEFIHVVKVWGTKGAGETTISACVPAWSSIIVCAASRGLEELKRVSKPLQRPQLRCKVPKWNRQLIPGNGLQIEIAQLCEDKLLWIKVLLRGWKDATWCWACGSSAPNRERGRERETGGLNRIKFTGFAQFCYYSSIHVILLRWPKMIRNEDLEIWYNLRKFLISFHLII